MISLEHMECSYVKERSIILWDIKVFLSDTR